MKKTLAMQLRERRETIEYRALRARLNAVAQDKNRKQEYRVLHMQPETIIKLQNEGIVVQKITEFGCDKYLLTWNVSKIERLAEQIKWAVDFNDKHISVPENELMDAENNCIVTEMRGLGFHIQSAIA